MTAGMDASTAPGSVGPVSCLPLQTRPVWDMGTIHAEERKGDSLQPARAEKWFHALGEPCLTFEPVVRVALAFTILI